MRLLRLTLRSVRGIADRSVDLTRDGSPTGVVIVEGPNEAGKSTLAFAFDQLLRSKASAGNAQVRSLKTVGSDEAPRVEADLVIGDQRMVYSKQYLQRRSTQLRFVDREGHPTGEVLDGDEAHERVTALLEEHLDRNLWESLLLRQGGGLEAPELHGSAGLSAVLGDLGDTGAIGARESAILDRAEQEHQRYYAPRAGTAARELKAARDKAGQAEARFQDVDARYQALTDDISEVGRLRQALPDLRGTAERAGAQAEQLQADLLRVKELRSLVERRRGALELAQTRLRAAQDAQQYREKLNQELTGLRDRVEQVATELEEATQHEAEAAARTDQTTERLDLAKAREHEARARRQLAQDDLDHLRLRREVAELRARFDQAEAADTRAREAAARRDANRVGPDAIARIRSASHQLAVARAALDAAVPQLDLTARADLDLQIGDEQATLTSGEERTWAITERLAIGLADLVDVEIRPGDSIDASRDAERTARTQLQDELAQVGQPDLVAAEGAAAERVAAVEQRGQAIAERDAILGGSTVDELRTQVQDAAGRLDAYLDARSNVVPLPEDENAALRLLAEAKNGESAASGELAEANTAVTGAKEEREGCRQATLARRNALRVIYEDRDRLQQELDAARAAESDADLGAKLAQLVEEREGAMSALRTAQQELDASDSDGIEEVAENAVLVAHDAHAAQSRTERSIGELEASIRARGAGGVGEQRAEAEVALERARSELAGVQRRADAVDRLVTVLREERARAQERYAAPLRERIVGYGRTLYGAGFDVELDERLAVTRRRADDLWLEVSALSVGAQEQLALLSRLACTALLAGQGGVLLIDDALGNTDPERLERLGAIIRSAGQDGQIIIFTCYPQRYAHIGGAKRIPVRRDPPAVPLSAGAEVTSQVEPADGATSSSSSGPNGSTVTGVGVEMLTCEQCGRKWSRPITRGRKPSRCESCREAG